MDTPHIARIVGLDLARCLALVGMVMVNFRLAMGVDTDQASGLQALFDALQGRSAATFVVLAGIGLALGVRQLDYDSAVHQTLRRSAFLLLVGLLNSLIFPADIIHYYAVYFVFGIALLPLSHRALLAMSAAVTLGFPVLAVVCDYNLGWNWATLDYRDFWTLGGFFRHLLFNGWHPVFPWLAFLLWGLFLARTALHTARVQLAMVLGGAALAASAHAASAQAIAWWPQHAQWLEVTPLPPMPLYTLAGAGVATCVIGLCLMLGQRWGHSAVVRAALPAGRMTLTLYIAHIVLGMGTLEAIGWLRGQGLHQVAWAAGVYCALAIAFAWVWAQRFRLGPLEGLMRRLTA